MLRFRLLQYVRRPGSGGRALLCAIVALALAIRLLVPQGWMPNGAGGLMMCSGSAPMAMAMAPAHDRHEMPAGHAQDHPCPFAALGLAAAPPASVAPVIPVAAAAASTPAAAFAITVGRGLAAPPPPATGPPAFV